MTVTEQCAKMVRVMDLCLLVLVTALIYFQCLPAFAISITPTRTHKREAIKIPPQVQPRKFIPPPENPRSPPPPSPAPAESPLADQSQRPLKLVEGQCSFGANSSLAGLTRIFSDARRLYVDVGRPASCSGEVIGWELCYLVQGLGNSIINIAVLRYNSNQEVYSIHASLELEVEQFGGSETAESTCSFIDSHKDLHIKKGDLIGFVCMENIRIALGALPSGVEGTLRIYNITIQQQQRQNHENLLGVTSIRKNQLTTFEQNVTPLLRIVMSK